MTRPLDQDIARHPFLLGMSRQDVGLLADCALRAHYEKGQLIFSEGDKADHLHLIQSGRVALEASSGADSILVEEVGAGELLGLSWLFPPHRWRVSARAAEPTTAVLINGALLRKYAERDHSLGFQLFKRLSEVMARRLESSRRRVLPTTAEQRSSVVDATDVTAPDDGRKCE